MRRSRIMTISLPPGMAKQMEIMQKKEHRTRSELLREAWRVYFEMRFPSYVPTKAEMTAIKKGRAAIKRGEYISLDQLDYELEALRNKTRLKGSVKN